MEKKLWLMIISSLVLILTACGDGESTAENESETSAEESGGTLEIAFNAQPPTLDPLATTATATRDISRNIFEQLVSFDSEYGVQPMLAESYEIEDDIVTFKLREGVLFHNGEEMMADDVVASMERWAEMSSQAITFMDGVTFKEVDDYTVEVQVPTPGFIDMFIFADLTQIAAIMPIEVIEGIGTDGLSEYVGTGPYTFNEWSQDQYILLDKFEDYSQPAQEADGLIGKKEASFDQIVFNIVTDASTRVSGISSGQYDIANFIPFDNVEMLEGTESVELSINESSFPGLVFNKEQGVFASKEMRQAVNAALNIDDIMLAAYGNEDLYELRHELMDENQTDWYTDAGADKYNQQDTALAEQLIEESGYDGELIRILTSREYDDYYSMAVSTQSQLQALGLNVELDVYDWATVLERRDDPEAYEIFTTGWAIRPTPVQYPFIESSARWPGWTNSEELDSLIEQIKQTEDVSEVKELSKQFQEEFWDYLPIIKPGNSMDVTALNEELEGFDFVAGPILWNTSK